MKYARIINERAVDIATDPASQFHRDLAAQFVEVTDEVDRGWIRDDTGTWSAPPAPEPQPEPTPEPAKVSPIEFKLLWRPTERVNLRTLRETDPFLEDLWELVEDPRITQVDLGLTSTQQAVTYAVQKLVENGTIAAADEATRVAEILAG